MLAQRRGAVTIFHRIRDLREDADLTQTELSNHLHISQRSYSHYENGTRDIPTNILIAIADYYDVSVDYLLERTNQKRSHHDVSYVKKILQNNDAQKEM